MVFKILKHYKICGGQFVLASSLQILGRLQTRFLSLRDLRPCVNYRDIARGYQQFRMGPAVNWSRRGWSCVEFCRAIDSPTASVYSRPMSTRRLSCKRLNVYTRASLPATAAASHGRLPYCTLEWRHEFYDVLRSPPTVTTAPRPLCLPVTVAGVPVYNSNPEKVSSGVILPVKSHPHG